MYGVELPTGTRALNRRKAENERGKEREGMREGERGWRRDGWKGEADRAVGQRRWGLGDVGGSCLNYADAKS